MRANEATARLSSGVIALAGIAGLIGQLVHNLQLGGGALAAIWGMTRFFTDVGNALVVAVFAAIAVRGRAAVAPGLIGLATLNILLVGIVFSLLLRGTHHPAGLQLLVSHIQHDLIPPLVALWWLVLAPHGQLPRHSPLRWLLLPLAYGAYVLVRGAFDGIYPYGFINPDTIGWGGVALSLGVIGLGFVLAGYALCWIDRRLAQRALIPAT